MSQHFFNRLDNLIAAAKLHPDDATPAAVLARAGSPTTSIAILENGTITTHTLSTQPSDHPTINADTLFQACSISKPVAGFAAIRLIEQGFFKLDTRIVDVLPEKTVNLLCPEHKYNTSVRGMFQQITVKHLLSHTSGLSIHGFRGYEDRNAHIDADQVLSGAEGITSEQVRLISPPGHSFTYSGGGITVLQRIMEHATGASFEQIMRELVFEPLGMNRSFYSLPAKEENIAPAYHTGYTPCKEKWHYQPELAAAGLWSTPGDLLKVTRAVQKALNGDADALIKQDAAREMLTQIDGEWALGFSADERSFAHSGGNVPGYRCYLLGFADLRQNARKDGHQDPTAGALEAAGSVPRNCGVAVMTNSATGDAVFAKVLQAVSYLKGWGRFDLSRPTVVTPFAVPAAESLDDWREWVGTWKCPDNTDTAFAKIPTWYIDSDRNVKPVGPPIAGIDRAAMGRLIPAAMPAVAYSNKRHSIDFVLEGMEFTLRFKWEQKKDDAEPQRVVEIWNSGLACITILRRV